MADQAEERTIDVTTVNGAAALEARVQCWLSGRIHDFRLVVAKEGLVLRGRADLLRETTRSACGHEGVQVADPGQRDRGVLSRGGQHGEAVRSREACGEAAEGPGRPGPAGASGFVKRRRKPWRS